MPDIEFEFVLLRRVNEHIDSPIEYLQSIKKYIKGWNYLYRDTA